ncbi:MAG: LamB/YcsF family protein [Caulobacteraceae bacterium]|nr:LamB/YcsF family protein [Caulobacteraceae bacterium]
MTQPQTIDLNSDLGEGFGPWSMGDDAAMLDIVTSANVACGGHASDPDTMHRTLTLARERGIVVGAHPSYPDLAGFGRRRLPCTPGEIERFTAAQTGALMAIGALVGHPVRYVKPHGALANVAADETEIAEAIVRAVRAVDPRLAILAISGTQLEISAREAGAPVYSEIFADRGYTQAGRLVPRGQPDAMIEDAKAAADRLLAWLESGRMPVQGGGEIELAGHSIYIHGDSPHAVSMARVVRDRLTAQGVDIAPFLEKTAR